MISILSSIKSVLNTILTFYRNLSIVRKISLSSLVTIIIPVIILAVVSHIISSDLIIKNAVNNGLQNLDLIAENVQSLLDHTNDLSRIIVSNDYVQEIGGIEKTLNESQKIEAEFMIRIILDSIISPRDIISSVVLYLDNGSMFCSGHVDFEKLKNNKKNIIYSLHDDGKNWGKPVIRDTHPIRYEFKHAPRHVITLSRDIISVKRADVVGTIDMNIPEEKFSNFLKNVQYGKSGTYLIANSAGTIISSPDENSLYKTIEKDPYVNWMNMTREGGKVFSLNNRKVLYTVRHIEPHDWMIIGKVPLKEVIGDGRKTTLLIIIIAALCLIIAALFSYLFSHSITKPIIELSETMNAAGQGDLEVRAHVTNKDEIGILAERFNSMIHEISELMFQVYEEQHSKREIELQALQAQIKPHFLYNTLDSLCSLIQLKENNKAFNMTKSLSLFYSNVISKGDNIINLSDEINIVRNFLQIETIRYPGKFDYTFHMEKGIEHVRIVKLTLQPLVENAIYHGFREVPYRGLIEIEGMRKDGHVVILIRDNGKGFNQNPKSILSGEIGKDQKRGSFGLLSVDERLKIYFGNNYGLTISDNNEKTEIRVIIPQ